MAKKQKTAKGTITKARAVKCLREVVKIINCSVDDSNKNARALRDILSALRGPDAIHRETEYVKQYTTGVIRRDIGLHDGSGLVLAGTRIGIPNKLAVRYADNHPLTHHFVGHIERAQVALRHLGIVP